MAATIHPLPVPSSDLDARFARAWEAAEQAEFLAAIKTARALRLAQEAGCAAIMYASRCACDRNGPCRYPLCSAASGPSS